MREFDVLWTEEAVRDLEEVVSYIALERPMAARKVHRRLQEKADGLWALPESGRIVPELLDIGLRTWRELIVRPYRIIYRVAGSRVYVEVVMDGRRDAEALLLERLLRP